MNGFTSKMSTVLPACSGDANTNRSVKSRRGSSPGNLSIAALKWLDILAPCVDGFGKNDSATGARSPLCHTGVPSLVRDTAPLLYDLGPAKGRVGRQTQTGRDRPREQRDRRLVERPRGF